MSQTLTIKTDTFFYISEPAGVQGFQWHYWPMGNTYVKYEPICRLRYKSWCLFLFGSINSPTGPHLSGLSERSISVVTLLPSLLSAFPILGPHILLETHRVLLKSHRLARTSITGPQSTLLTTRLWTASASVGPSKSQLFATWNPDLQSRQILWCLFISDLPKFLSCCYGLGYRPHWALLPLLSPWDSHYSDGTLPNLKLYP